MKNVILDYGCLKDSRKEGIDCLRQLRADSADDAAICHALIEAVQAKHISVDNLRVFLQLSRNPDALKTMMACESSPDIRRCAVRELRRRFRRPRLTNGQPQDNLLDAPELIKWLSKRSVHEVSYFCALIGCGNKGARLEGRERAVEDLLRGLLPGLYAGPDATRPLDGRPLGHQYAKMLPACSPAFVKQVLDSHDNSNPLYKGRNIRKLVRCHPELFKSRAEEQLLGKAPYEAELSTHIDELFARDRQFAIEMVRARAERRTPEKPWKLRYELNLLLPMVAEVLSHRHITKEREQQVLELVQLGLSSAKAYNYAPGTVVRGDHLFAVILKRWNKRSDLYEDVLVQAIKLGLCGPSSRIPQNYVKAAAKIDDEKRPHLLQMIFLHSPECGVHIFDDDDDKLSVLKGQSWPRALFDHITEEQTIRILKSLCKINVEHSFLELPIGPNSPTTILSMWSGTLQQPNFKADLFLTMLQRQDVAVQQAAKAAIASLRKKAEAAREPVDRATFAQAAVAYSIATGDLDVYGDTITWQQRYVRDGITLKAVIARHMVLTEEGIELLAAIPKCKEQNKYGCACVVHSDLDTIRSNINKADTVLQHFQSTFIAAQRERTFQEHDWESVCELVGLVFMTRVERMKSFHKASRAPMQDIQAIVWDGILSAINWMERSFLFPILPAIRKFLESLAPKSKVDAIEALQAFSRQRRDRPDSNLVNFYLTKLEHLTNDALSDLAHSDQPALAWPLVVRMILDQPTDTVAHRQLLCVGFLRKLQPEETQNLLTSLAKAIGEKLKEAREKDAARGIHKDLQPIVKVSTVKHITQLLNNADFISKVSSVDILAETFKVAHHRDIRVAALDSLLGVLHSICSEVKDAWVDNAAVQKGLAALETAVPVAGSIDERQPLSADDWAKAEATGVLPEIADISAGEDNCYVLMKALVMAADNQRYPGLKRIQGELVKRITLPILQRSQEEHVRWIRLFLAKYEAPFSASAVPPTPVAIKTWTDALLKFYPLVESSGLLEDITRYSAYRIKPTQSAAVQQFNAKLRADAELRKRPEVKHWLRIYDDTGIEHFRNTETATFLRLLQDRASSSSWSSGEEDYGAVVDAVCQHASLFLDDYNKYVGVWEEFVSALRPTPWYLADPRLLTHWRATYGAILEKVCAEVAKRRRKGATQPQPDGTTTTTPILPFLTKARLWLLSLPLANSVKEDGDGKRLAREVDELLWDIFQENEDAVLRLESVRWDMSSGVSELLQNKAMRVAVAGELGRRAASASASAAGGDGDGSVQYRAREEAVRSVEVWIAIALFGLLKGTGSKQVKRVVKECVELWDACQFGLVREAVFHWKRSIDFLEFAN